MKRMLSAVKPTGQITLGNYIGAIKNFVKYQEDYEMYIFVANLHCITVYQKPEELKKNLKDAVALYLACGLNPDKATIFLQSDVLQHAQLGYILQCNSYLGELNRMTQFKDKIAKNEQGLSVGLYTYPCLMAADILLYDADYVPVGDDQKQHVELTRDIAIRFNNKYGETFKVPEPLVSKVGKRIMSLNDPSKKMSKSEGNDKGCIYLLDDLNVIRKKIMSAVTDSIGEFNIDQVNQAGLYNLMEILEALTGESKESIAKRYQGQGYGEFKKEVAEVVVNEIAMIQKNYQAIIASGKIDEILYDGAKKASHLAHKKLDKVQRKIGIEIHKRK